MATNMLIEQLSDPLNGATAAKIDIHVGDGNLTIDRLTSGDKLLASGTLQYSEAQGLPTHTLTSRSGQVSLTLKAGRGKQTWFRFPWAACNGATHWQIHLNPSVVSDVTAHSHGGNVKVDLSGMIVTCASVETGGGNVDLILPAEGNNLRLAAMTGGGNVHVEIGRGTTGNNILHAKSGGGNVFIDLPDGLAARIYATTGLGKVSLAPQFSRIDNNTYQSVDFDNAVNRVEIIAQSGAGNVGINTK